MGKPDLERQKRQTVQAAMFLRNAFRRRPARFRGLVDCGRRTVLVLAVWTHQGENAEKMGDLGSRGAEKRCPHRTKFLNSGMLRSGAAA